MYFPLSGVETQPWAPPLAGLVISFFTSMSGVSGAFLLVPFQMSVLGAHNPSLSATNQFYNVVAVPSGVYRYMREGRMVWPLALAIVLGTLPGVFLGALTRITLMPDRQRFLPFAALVLALIGVRVVLDILAVKQKGAKHASESTRQADEKTADNQVRCRSGDFRRIAFSFQGRDYAASTPAILLIALIVGIVGGIYGIGGGAIISPLLTSVMGLPIHAVAGAALLGTLMTSVAGVLFFLFLAPFFPHLAVAPDWALGLLFGLGGMAGMYLGARCQKYMPALAIKILLAVVLLSTAAKYLWEWLA